mgnify:CR=1 FL=1
MLITYTFTTKSLLIAPLQTILYVIFFIYLVLGRCDKILSTESFETLLFVYSLDRCTQDSIVSLVRTQGISLFFLKNGKWTRGQLNAMLILLCVSANKDD